MHGYQSTAGLRALPLGTKVSPEPGCCGMAGPFGFDTHKYEVSRTIAEQALLPAVRLAAPDAILISDSFSCREQILQGANREAVHSAEAVWDVMRTR